METLESAQSLILENTIPLTETEILPLDRALHYVLANDLVSPMDVPPFDRSPLDGYALHSEDLAGASREHPVYLKVIGEADAGCPTIFHPARGEALRIMTGAPVPEDCDCVIRQEVTDEGMETAAFFAEEKHGANICLRGEDIPKGKVMIHGGSKLSSYHLSAMASVGCTEAEVFRRPRVAVVCTGDELTQPGETLPFGHIYDSSRMGLTMRLRELGVDVVSVESVPDDAEKAAKILLNAMNRADLLLTTGGVSVGKKDIMHQVLPLMGAERLFWKLSLKPGSPTLCGKVGNKLMICLSGNPFSATAIFEILVVPCLRKLSGCSDVFSFQVFDAQLQNAFMKKSPMRRLIRGRYDGRTVFIPENQTNGAMLTMIGCNCIVDIPAGSGALPAGTQVNVIPLESY